MRHNFSRGGWIAAIACVGVVVGAWLYATHAASSSIEPQHDEENQLSADVWNVLEHADHYELISVDPEFPQAMRNRGATRPVEIASMPTTEATTRPGTINGFTVLGTLSIIDAKTQGELNDALRQSMKDWPHMVSGCIFQPRHALRVTKGSDTVVILICFHCGDVQASFNGKSQGYLYVNSVTPPIFNDLLKAAKIPQDPDA